MADVRRPSVDEDRGRHRRVGRMLPLTRTLPESFPNPGTFAHIYATWSGSLTITGTLSIMGYDCIRRLVKRALTTVKRKARRRAAYAAADVKPYHRLSKISKEKIKANARIRMARVDKEVTRRRDAEGYARNRAKRLADKKAKRDLPSSKAARRQTLRSNPELRIHNRLRRRLHTALSGRKDRKSGRPMQLLGCSRAEFLEYLQRDIPDDADIADYHIDHIFPFVAYDMSMPDHQRRVMHYSNMQLLLPHDNISKNDKLPSRMMSSRVERWAWPDGIGDYDLPVQY